MTINFNDFNKIDMRVGTIIQTEEFKKAKNPSFKIWINFGKELGIKKTSAQLTNLYHKDDLIGKQVVAVVNFPPKQIADFMSECLILGAVEKEGKVTIIQPENNNVENGTKIS